MRINAGRVILALATIVAVVLIVGFVAVYFFGYDLVLSPGTAPGGAGS